VRQDTGLQEGRGIPGQPRLGCGGARDCVTDSSTGEGSSSVEQRGEWGEQPSPVPRGPGRARSRGDSLTLVNWWLLRQPAYGRFTQPCRLETAAELGIKNTPNGRVLRHPQPCTDLAPGTPHNTLQPYPRRQSAWLPSPPPPPAPYAKTCGRGKFWTSLPHAKEMTIKLGVARPNASSRAQGETPQQTRLQLRGTTETYIGAKPQTSASPY